MPAKRLKRLTTFYLAALYGVIGLSGGSLHYLVSDWSAFWSGSDSSENVESVVYFHVHAPDHHGHFHRHTVRVRNTHETAEAERGVGQSKGPTAKSSDTATHRPHACPLLHLISKLKVVHTDGTPQVTLELASTLTLETKLLFTREFARDTYARGPPSDSLA